MATVTLTLEEYEALRSMAVGMPPAVEIVQAPKKKRKKISKYGKEFGRQLKMLIKKHPRTKVTQLMSQAHRNTKRALK